MQTNLIPPFAFVSHMNTAFGNAKGNPMAIDRARVEKQINNIGGKFDPMYLEGKIDGEVKELLLEMHNWQQAEADLRQEFVGTPRHNELMMACSKAIDGVRDALCDIQVFVQGAQHLMGIDGDQEMNDVVNAVLTRFCPNEEVLAATCEKYKALGVIFYIEGEFPNVFLKSATDQTDNKGETYSKGKFLKSTSFRETSFRPLSFYVESRAASRKFFGSEKLNRPTA